MDAAAERLEFAPPDEPAAVRGFAIAVIAHLLLAAALTWGINWKKDVEEVAAEAELWSATPQQAAPPAPVAPPPPPPVPEPEVVKAPPPPPVSRPDPAVEQQAQRDAQIVIEREKRKQERLEEKRLEQEAQKKAEAKRRLEEERRAELAEKKAAEKAAQKASEAKAAERKLAEKRAAEKAAERAEAEDRRKDELAKAAKSKQEAARLEAQRKENIARMMQSATGVDGGRGSDKQTSGSTSASYGGRVQARVRPYIVFPEDAPGNPQAEVEVRTSPDGTIVGSRILKPSGVKAWDDAVLAALTKAEVLPRDVDGRVPTPLVIVFRRRN